MFWQFGKSFILEGTLVCVEGQLSIQTEDGVVPISNLLHEMKGLEIRLTAASLEELDQLRQSLPDSSQ